MLKKQSLWSRQRTTRFTNKNQSRKFAAHQQGNEWRNNRPDSGEKARPADRDKPQLRRKNLCRVNVQQRKRASDSQLVCQSQDHPNRRQIICGDNEMTVSTSWGTERVMIIDSFFAQENVNSPFIVFLWNSAAILNARYFRDVHRRCSKNNTAVRTISCCNEEGLLNSSERKDTTTLMLAGVFKTGCFVRH